MMRDFNHHDVLFALNRHIGSTEGISADGLCEEITQDDIPRAVAKRRLRALVVDLRMQGCHVCAHPSMGYFMARTEEELNATCEFLYQRAMTSLKQIAAMKRVSLPDLRGQLRLPT